MKQGQLRWHNAWFFVDSICMSKISTPHAIVCIFSIKFKALTRQNLEDWTDVTIVGKIWTGNGNRSWHS